MDSLICISVSFACVYPFTEPEIAGRAGNSTRAVRRLPQLGLSSAERDQDHAK